MTATSAATKPTRGAANITGVWTGVLLRSYRGRVNKLTKPGCGGWKGCATDMRNLAAQEGCDVCKGHQGASSDESNGWLHVESVGPHGEQRAPVVEPGRVVDPYGVGRKAQDGDAAEKGEGGDGHPGSIDQLESLGLPLEVVVVLRVDLKGR